MTTGAVSIPGRLQLCSVCGGVVAFVELYADGRKNRQQSSRLTLATTLHVLASPRCKGGGVFDGPDLWACRCAVPLRMERSKGLYCAKCNGLIAPQLQPVRLPRSEEARVPCRTRSTRS